MSAVRTLQGDLAAGELRLAVVAARFNDFIVERLIQGALDALRQNGVSAGNVDLVRVPGAFELPLAAARLLKTGRYGAVIALGAIVRGETPHFDFVAGECARGLGQLAIDSGVPIAFGVLTTDTVEQALARAGVHDETQGAGSARAREGGDAPGKDGTRHGNKGAEAAECALEMANLLRRLER
jgi:6,7-dimethyl-8-ribityllumazine synthase